MLGLVAPVLGLPALRVGLLARLGLGVDPLLRRGALLRHVGVALLLLGLDGLLLRALGGGAGLAQLAVRLVVSLQRRRRLQQLRRPRGVALARRVLRLGAEP